MKNTDAEGYFQPKTYLGFIVRKAMRGEVWRGIEALYKKIRRFTRISAVFRWIGIAVALLEKSAVLLLFATCFVILLPIVILFALAYALTCVSRYISIRPQISNWLKSTENLTVFITKERIFSNEQKLFLREALLRFQNTSQRAVIVCRDRFIAAKWYNENLLAVRCDYYFILKQYYLPKISQKTTVVVL